MDKREARSLYRLARIKHNGKQWDDAREMYERVVNAEVNVKLTADAKDALALVAQQKRASGKLGYWAIGLVATALLVLLLVNFLPPGLHGDLSLVIMGVVGVAGFAAFVCAVRALIVEAGLANKLSAIAVLVGAAALTYSVSSEDDKKLDRVAVVEGLSMAGVAKIGVVEHYFSTGQFPASNEQANIAAADTLRGNHVNSVTVSEGGVITIEYSYARIAGQTVIVRPSWHNCIRS